MKQPAKQDAAEVVLHKEYRPRKWDEVVGQSTAIKVLSSTIKRRSSQAFLLLGPSGVGKTTLARIAALELGCGPEGLREIPAAVFTGVNDMRGIMEMVQYRPFGEDAARCLLVDECHRLSGSAWDALLKAIEEPAPHVFWFFCTTNATKVPATIKTRCTPITLKPIPEKELGALYDDVCDAEKINIPGDVGDMIIREAKGSARQMLVDLDACRDVKDKRTAAAVLQTAIETEAVLDLCRYLAASKGSWGKVMRIFERLEDDNPEGVRIVVCNYFASAIKKATSDRQACFFLGILDAFADPYNAAENAAPLLRSIGRVIFAPSA